MSDIKETLKERGKRYGEFDSHAQISQDIITAIRGDLLKWQSLRPFHREALTIIAHKIARIMNGDPNYIDNWHDICGYSKLVEDILTKEQNLEKCAPVPEESSLLKQLNNIPPLQVRNVKLCHSCGSFMCKCPSLATMSDGLIGKATETIKGD